MNELIRERRNEFEGQDVTMHSIMCECIDPSCSEMLLVSDEDLQLARSSEDWFVVEPTHINGSKLIVRSNSHCVISMPTT